MPLLITRNGTDWIPCNEGEGASGPCWGFDTDSNGPVFRLPDGSGWVNGLGEPISIFGSLHFTSRDSALVAVLL